MLRPNFCVNTKIVQNVSVDLQDQPDLFTHAKHQMQTHKLYILHTLMNQTTCRVLLLAFSTYTQLEIT